jgi:hypothetical protein
MMANSIADISDQLVGIAAADPQVTNLCPHCFRPTAPLFVSENC